MLKRYSTISLLLILISTDIGTKAQSYFNNDFQDPNSGEVSKSRLNTAPPKGNVFTIFCQGREGIDMHRT